VARRFNYKGRAFKRRKREIPRSDRVGAQNDKNVSFSAGSEACGQFDFELASG